MVKSQLIINLGYNKSTIRAGCDNMYCIMNENEEVKCQLSSSAWYVKEGDELLKKYRASKSEFEKVKMLPKMIAMLGKLKFQLNEINKYIPDELRGEFNLN